MAGRICPYLANDHDRLDGAFQRAIRDPDRIDVSAYSEFREGLLRHISMEEKILFPAARAANGGQSLVLVAKLHLDHGALAALLVPTPTRSIIVAIQTVLDRHNPVEEGASGVYEQCEQLLAADVEAVLLRLQNAPAVAVADHVDNSTSMKSARDALRRAGYNLEL